MMEGKYITVVYGFDLLQSRVSMSRNGKPRLAGTEPFASMTVVLRPYFSLYLYMFFQLYRTAKLLKERERQGGEYVHSLQRSRVCSIPPRYDLKTKVGENVPKVRVKQRSRRECWTLNRYKLDFCPLV